MFNQYRSFLMTTTETNENVSETFSQMPMAKKIREVLKGVVILFLFSGFGFLLFTVPFEILTVSILELEAKTHYRAFAMTALFLMVLGFIYWAIVYRMHLLGRYKVTGSRLKTLLLLLGSVAIFVTAIAMSYALREYPFFEYHYNLENYTAGVMIGLVALWAFVYTFVDFFFKRWGFYRTEQ